MKTVETELGVMPNERFFGAGYFLTVGLLATFTMDLAALILLMSGLIQLGPYKILPNLLGRWVGSFPGGTVFHSTILNAAPIRHEKVLGILCHYLIGVALTSLIVYPHIRIWCRAITFRNALVYGMVTCIFPWFLMFPAMGFGVMGLKLNNAGILMGFSFLNHAAFGMGIFMWSHLFNRRLLKIDRYWALSSKNEGA